MGIDKNLIIGGNHKKLKEVFRKHPGCGFTFVDDKLVVFPLDQLLSDRFAFEKTYNEIKEPYQIIRDVIMSLVADAPMEVQLKDMVDGELMVEINNGVAKLSVN